MTTITGAVALVTGGAGGIGGAIAQRLAHDGATVVTTDLPGTTADLAADVRDEDALRDVVARVRDDHGCIDLVIAAAGIGVGGSSHPSARGCCGG